MNDYQKRISEQFIKKIIENPEILDDLQRRLEEEVPEDWEENPLPPEKAGEDS
jgi:hypothetical protein